MLFKYKILTKEGEMREGTIDSLNEESAIRSLQQRGFTIVSIASFEKKGFFEKQLFLSKHIPIREIVILSRQIATLFSARVSVLKAFRMLSDEVDNPLLRQTMNQITLDVQGGMTIADALDRHPLIFSNFYVNMVRAGEESGKLSDVFEFLADYLNRNYELVIKIRNALMYPAFIIGVFIIVLILLLTLIFPQLSQILREVGQEIPLYTRIVIGVSDFLVEYGVFLLALVLIGGFFLFRFIRTEEGSAYISRLGLETPIIGSLLQKFYLSRIADNIHTMLQSGIPLVRTLEITAAVVGDATYRRIIQEAVADVKSGTLVSETFSKHHEEIPGIMIQIIRAGEETGELGSILKTLADFYRREVYHAVDGLLGLIEPLLIVFMGLGIGVVVASVLIPIYNIASGF